MIKQKLDNKPASATDDWSIQFSSALSQRCERTLSSSERCHSVILHDCDVIGPIPWVHSGPLCHALSLSSSLSVVVVVDIDAQAARDSTASDTW